MVIFRVYNFGVAVNVELYRVLMLNGAFQIGSQRAFEVLAT